jgi:putative methyltransferase (TIGR04325 family)
MDRNTQPPDVTITSRTLTDGRIRFGQLLTDECSGFFGNFRSWSEAAAHCDGYASELILERTLQATLKVKNGQAAYERDSVTFDAIQYDWHFPLIACLLKVAAERPGGLRVLDFGGSLGGTFFAVRSFLSALPSLRWCVVEQAATARCGRQALESDELTFSEDLAASLAGERYDVIVLSGVIQYLEAPHSFLEQLVNGPTIPYVFLDRVPHVNGPDRLTVQRVPPRIYDATYPAWFLNRDGVLAHFQRDFDLIAEFRGLDSANIPSVHKGYFLRRR